MWVTQAIREFRGSQGTFLCVTLWGEGSQLENTACFLEKAGSGADRLGNMSEQCGCDRCGETEGNSASGSCGSQSNLARKASPSHPKPQGVPSPSFNWNQTCSLCMWCLLLHKTSPTYYIKEVEIKSKTQHEQAAPWGETRMRHVLLGAAPVLSLHPESGDLARTSGSLGDTSIKMTNSPGQVLSPAVTPLTEEAAHPGSAPDPGSWGGAPRESAADGPSTLSPASHMRDLGEFPATGQLQPGPILAAIGILCMNQ